MCVCVQQCKNMSGRPDTRRQSQGAAGRTRERARVGSTRVCACHSARACARTWWVTRVDPTRAASRRVPRDAWQPPHPTGDSGPMGRRETLQWQPPRGAWQHQGGSCCCGAAGWTAAAAGLHGQHDGSIRAGPAGSVSRGRRGGRGGPLRPCDCAAPVLAPAILAASRPGGGDMGRQPAETRRPGSRDGGRGGHTNRPRYRKGRNDKLDSQGQPSLPPSAAPARPGPSLRPAYL